jgi:hypothetical protein
VKWYDLPASLSTWEDLDALKQRFPAASAAQGEGDVTTPALPDEVQRQDVSTVMGQRRSSRVRKPSVRVVGPEWSSGP